VLIAVSFFLMFSAVFLTGVTPGEGFNLFRSYLLACLAAAYGQVGEPKAGLQVLTETLALCFEDL
jgi:hypothetical protein